MFNVAALPGLPPDYGSAQYTAKRVGTQSMKLLAQDDDQVDVRLNIAELVLLHNALEEICHGFQLSDRDFQEILGVNRNDATVLLRRADQVLERLGIVPAEN
jgi:hypothetical protein